MTCLYSLVDWADGDASNWQDIICLEEAATRGTGGRVHLIVLLEDKLIC